LIDYATLRLKHYDSLKSIITAQLGSHEFLFRRKEAEGEPDAADSLCQRVQVPPDQGAK
jgi:hypothetical protein